MHSGADPRPAASPHTWAAPTPTSPVEATVTVPGSKSWTNRWLPLAALATGTSHLHAPLDARDTRAMAAALRALGHTVTTPADGPWSVTPSPDWRSPAGPIDCDQAGTVLRFLAPLASLADGPVTFTGETHLGFRPLTGLLDALRSLGVRAQSAPGADGVLPLTLTGRLAPPDPADPRVELDARASSQFVSALLLAGTTLPDGLTITATGEVPSLPHVEMTRAALAHTGVRTEQRGEGSWWVEGKRPDPVDVTVEPDLSSAAVFLAAAAVTGGRVTVTGWPERTTQGGDHVRGLLERMGARCVLDADGLTVTGPAAHHVGGSGLHGIEADLGACGELTPVLTALCALADGPSTLTGIGHLRGHETDRLAALATEINTLGGEVRELPDGLEITPRPLHAGRFSTYHDHRMAMAGAVLGLAVPGLLVEDVETTDKTLPGFTGRWERLLGRTT
nr:3-phosphoshikimate 1-carboxyvinyltransferase [Kytococcus aerolatus]